MRNHAPNAVSCLKRRASRSSATHPDFSSVPSVASVRCFPLKPFSRRDPRCQAPFAAPLLLAGFALG
jgi:hypothetical protein